MAPILQHQDDDEDDVKDDVEDAIEDDVEENNDEKVDGNRFLVLDGANPPPVLRIWEMQFWEYEKYSFDKWEIQFSQKEKYCSSSLCNLEKGEEGGIRYIFCW